ncbi:hypothetical protein PRZ48_007006 [Zasmidium cellare]|uniref:Nucleotide-diphospho-sugar transferase n=1 Tax=Zasmidium cellare TaxID=395010 RepID=A0ABR0EI51_ZASCE|nr:hypothetical protein PRZ48_007006 [Zasmidium cellare]
MSHNGYDSFFEDDSGGEQLQSGQGEQGGQGIERAEHSGKEESKQKESTKETSTTTTSTEQKSIEQQLDELSIIPNGDDKRAYITLLTRASYLAGVVILAHTLKQQGSKYPLIVLYTSTLTEAALDALELEAEKSNLILKPCNLLIPAEHHELNVAVKRFEDTWTKLRVFEHYDEGFDTLCYLDADMTILKNMDSVFECANKIPTDSIGAVHDCVCSPDKEEWTPEDHCADNCALNASTYPGDLMTFNKENSSKRTFQLFNSGMFVFHPSESLWDEMLKFFDETPLLGTFRFPDQDFLIHFFSNRWVGLLWKYNAVKTMAYRHENLWDKDQIVCLHYIVDKPWAKRIGEDGVAGFKGKDGETHRWWWDEYEAWATLRQEQGEFKVVAIMSKHVARRESEVSDTDRPDMDAIGANVHDTKENEKELEASEDENEDENEEDEEEWWFDEQAFKWWQAGIRP